LELKQQFRCRNKVTQHASYTTGTHP